MSTTPKYPEIEVELVGHTLPYLRIKKNKAQEAYDVLLRMMVDSYRD